jgi:RimJ/RimL family protein N-acetyltransferase
MEDYRIWLIALAPRPIGVGGFFPRSSITAETHMAFLPEAWGPLAQDAFFHMLAWIRLNSSFRRLVGEIPQSNRAAIRFAEQAGFRQYAMNEKSIVRRGRREDQVCMALDLD